jgi:predicted secreted hydrolase
VSRGEPQRRFGYQFVIFRVGLYPGVSGFDSEWDAANVLMGHAAITDRDAAEHRFSEVLYREAPFLAQFNAHPEPVIAWSLAPLGTDGRWKLTRKGEAFDLEMVDLGQGIALELNTAPSKARLFQGPGGFSRKSDEPGASSMYYSYTRMHTQGTLRIDDESWQVDGVSWMDHEFSSNQLTEEQAGWDWFGLRLDDGRDLMLYELRRKNEPAERGRLSRRLERGAAVGEAPVDYTTRRGGSREPQSCRHRHELLGRGRHGVRSGRSTRGRRLR